MNITYGLEESPRGAVFILASLQWLMFMVANVITVPIVLGHALALSEAQIALFTTRTLFLCGLVSLAQGLWGHRFAIVEGPAGMWWGVFLVLIQMTQEMHGSINDLQVDLELGLMVAGVLYVVLAATGWLQRIQGWFTPAVTGCFLVLLTMQVSRDILDGLLGIGFRGSPEVRPLVAGLSFLLIVFTLLLMVKGRGLWKNMAVLVALVSGWLLYGVIGWLDIPSRAGQSAVALPRVFPWGRPVFHASIVITCGLTVLILLSNLIASIQAFAGAAGEQPTPGRYRRGTLVSGLGTALAGVFGTVGAVPLTAAAGLVSLTGIASRLPFLVAAGALTLMGLFPVLGEYAATLPPPVGYAVLFTVFVQLLGYGLRDIKRLSLDGRDLWVVGLPLVTGVGLLFVPGSAWATLPPVCGYLLGNGLIVGVILVLLLEHGVFRRSGKTTPASTAGGRDASDG
ncbi:MAG: purine/pyrimidine permease [Alicyclobacillus shizuokensis]|nr:purine/pyrimidine permease [Alicyclobacillus shizuokensis]